MSHKLTIVMLMYLSLLNGFAAAEKVVFKDVQSRFPQTIVDSKADRRMIQKSVDLVFDDDARRLTTQGEANVIDVSYDQVTKVVFDVSTRSRRGVAGAMMGGIVGTMITTAKIHDYWCYLEYKAADGSTKKYLMEIDKDHAAAVEAKTRFLFPGLVQTAEVEDFGELEKDMFPDRGAKFSVDVDKNGSPIPVVRPDRALVVVACPAPRPGVAGSKLVKIKFHANGKIVAVNAWGAYSYLYLPAGEYLIASESGFKPRGGKVHLEAGKEYYFFQDSYGSAGEVTGLSRHSKELVTYEIEGSFYSLWQRKSPGEPVTATEMLR